MQYIMIMGFLGNDPEERTTVKGNKVINFSVGVSIYSKSSTVAGERNATQWYRVSVWNEKLHNKVSYLKRGSPVIVCGDLEIPKIYETKLGETKISLNISANAINFVSPSKNESKEEISFSASIHDEEPNPNELPF